MIKDMGEEREIITLENNQTHAYNGMVLKLDDYLPLFSSLDTTFSFLRAFIPKKRDNSMWK